MGRGRWVTWRGIMESGALVLNEGIDLLMVDGGWWMTDDDGKE